MSLEEELFKSLRPFIGQKMTDQTFEAIRSTCATWLAEQPLIVREHWKIQYSPGDRRLSLLICDCYLGVCHR